MNPEPRYENEYSPRQIKAARCALIDVGQVLASFQDCMVLVGGWVPDLLMKDVGEAHIGSIDVDIALLAEKLGCGRYAELLKLLLDTRRYRQGEKPFQLVTKIDLKDGEGLVQVEVDFLAPKEIELKKNNPKLLKGFRVLQADGCASAFHAPQEIQVFGTMVKGARNSVRLQVASLEDFLIMKAFAINGRDKPKDAYDLCYCLDHFPGGLSKLAGLWKSRLKNKDVKQAIRFLREKFPSIDAYGPQQVVEFHNSTNSDERAMQARRAFELVQKLLKLL